MWAPWSGLKVEFIRLCYLEPSVISAVLLFLEWDHWLVQVTALSPAPEVSWAQTGRSVQDTRQFQQTRQSPWSLEWTCNPKGSYRLDCVSRKTTKKNKPGNHKSYFLALPAILTSSEWLFFFFLSLPLGNKLKLCVYFCNTEKHKEKASQKDEPASHSRDLPTTLEKEK